MYNIFFSGDVNNGCIAQSVERWSNKPLVMGSSPIVTIFFFLGVRVAFVAERLRRYVQVVVNFVGVGSSPTECKTFFVACSSMEEVVESFGRQPGDRGDEQWA